ncbi:MAG: cytochrome b N-terminal domain-containing protein [Deltaproteobacteria bacterium]|nr:cytochrome b N-terminal domain-containing protein [Deltaproteobacteria bacterium]
MKLWTYLRERAAIGEPRGKLLTGASFAYVFGAVLMFLLLVQGVTGFALAAFYSPSTTDAWASVAYIQDQAPFGWFVRGLHHHGGSAIVIIAGVHLVQTAVSGAYKRPRELVWWLGILSLLLVLAFSVTGYWLRWDQAGFYASQIELGIAAATPVMGGAIKSLAIGGNDYGNLTLTRAYAVHVILLPALLLLVTYFHVRISRRLGPTPVRTKPVAVTRWPYQSMRDAIAIAVVFAILLAYVVSTHGVDLAAPADPTSAYDARPLWPFRWLFELRIIAAGAEQLVAMVVPAMFGGFLVALPLLDRRTEREPKHRKLWLGALAGLFAVVGALTVASFARDSNDEQLARRRATADKLATRARDLALTNGVPVTGPLDVFKTAPMWNARTLFATRCAGCHGVDSTERKGPVIGPGHGNRAWLTQFLKTPSGDAFYAHTKLAQTENAMKPVEIPAADMADLVELLYSDSGAQDVDVAKKDRGVKVFEAACTDCHTRDEGVASSAGPNLYGLNSRDYYTSFIGNPKAPIHMGSDKSQMPRFDRDLSIVDRDALAEYLVWLRTATLDDVNALGPL